jgi:hypothetical protein
VRCALVILTLATSQAVHAAPDVVPDLTAVVGVEELPQLEGVRRLVARSGFVVVPHYAARTSTIYQPSARDALCSSSCAIPA